MTKPPLLSTQNTRIPLSQSDFASLGLNPALVDNLASLGYITMTPIQAQALPPILVKKDVIARAKTGSGKTATFALGLLHNLDVKRFRVQTLVLCPTRELADQVAVEIRKIARGIHNVKVLTLCGGMAFGPQVGSLEHGAHIIVGTPGRVEEHLRKANLNLDNLTTLVLDEADRMLDMGFVRDINKIISFMPEKRQNLMFSATFSNDIKKLASGILKNPVSVATAPQNSTAKKVTHKVYKVDKKKKTAFTIKLVKENNWNQVLIFTRTKHGANKLTKKLIQAGVSSAAIHGNKSQGARTKALKNFKDNSIKILVATDIAARGLDIPLLPYVINFELPNVPEDYVHRIGRTGRAGAAGEAISLVCSEESEYQSEIEKLLKEKLNSTIVAGFEPTDTAPPKRAASQSKGSFSKKNKSRNSNSSIGSKSKRSPHSHNNKSAVSSHGSGRSGREKKKRY